MSTTWFAITVTVEKKDGHRNVDIDLYRPKAGHQLPSGSNEFLFTAEEVLALRPEEDCTTVFVAYPVTLCEDGEEEHFQVGGTQRICVWPNSPVGDLYGYYDLRRHEYNPEPRVFDVLAEFGDMTPKQDGAPAG